MKKCHSHGYFHAQRKADRQIHEAIIKHSRKDKQNGNNFLSKPNTETSKRS